MELFAQGYQYQKFFPAVPAGGVPFLKALSGPLPQVQFCPTGGVSADNAAEFLALPNVSVVGGSWVAPKTVVAKQDWAQIAQLAQAASAL